MIPGIRLGVIPGLATKAGALVNILQQFQYTCDQGFRVARGHMIAVVAMLDEVGETADFEAITGVPIAIASSATMPKLS